MSFGRLDFFDIHLRNIQKISRQIGVSAAIVASLPRKKERSGGKTVRRGGRDGGGIPVTTDD
jgi:hypothetical protein